MDHTVHGILQARILEWVDTIHYLLQWIFLTQESNQGLLHCRRILYQLSYQGSQNVLERFLYQPDYMHIEIVYYASHFVSNSQK